MEILKNSFQTLFQMDGWRFPDDDDDFFYDSFFFFLSSCSFLFHSPLVHLEPSILNLHLVKHSKDLGTLNLSIYLSLIYSHILYVV